MLSTLPKEISTKFHVVHPGKKHGKVALATKRVQGIRYRIFCSGDGAVEGTENPKKPSEPSEVQLRTRTLKR